MRVRFSARSDVGLRREVNQDAYGSEQVDQSTLLIVCDGMGGHAAGEVASRLGVDTIIATFHRESAPAQVLREAFALANQRIYAEGHGTMGTTGVAALLADNVLHVANVGDSRAYLVREGRISQISHDHSFVSDQVAAGLMTPEQARASNVRNIITRALGHLPEVEVDLFSLALRPGDTILLSSDGMHGLVEDQEIAELSSILPPEQAAQRLIDTANERGGTDNITVVIAQVDELDPSAAALPTPEPLSPEELSDDAALPPALSSPLRATSMAATAPAASAPSSPVERPLSRLGLSGAALALVVLLGLAGYLWATNGRGSTAAPPPPAATVLPAASSAPQPSTAPPAASPSAATASPAPSAAATRVATASATRASASPTPARSTPSARPTRPAITPSAAVTSTP